MTNAQFWTLVAMLGLIFVAFCVGVVVIVHRGANQIRRDLDEARR